MKQGVILCLEGEHAGAEIPLVDGQCVSVGRDMKWANLVYQDITVSRKQCQITYQEGSYYVMDYTQGQTTLDGGTLETGEMRRVATGSILEIGRGGSKIKLI